MPKTLVPIQLHKIMQTNAYTVVILGNEEKRFAIYTEPGVGKNMQLHLMKAEKPRPHTHDLLDAIFQGLNVKLLQVVINEIHDTIYFARLFLEQKALTSEIRQIVEIDVRPSDALSLAVMLDAPLFCTKDVLEKTIPIEE